MMFLQATLPWFVGLGTMFIIAHCICAINRMNHDTSGWVFAATAIVAIGAFGELCSVAAGEAVTVSEALLIAGVVASITANRRDAPACPCVLVSRQGFKNKKEPPHAVV